MVAKGMTECPVVPGSIDGSGRDANEEGHTMNVKDQIRKKSRYSIAVEERMN